MRRQRYLELSEEVKEIAWKAQHRLHKRYTKLTAKGKNKNQTVTTVGRELLGFIWDIAVQTERRKMLRRFGVEIADQTMCGWMMRQTAELLGPRN